MKKHGFFVVSMLLLLMLGLSSCNHNAEKLIVGKWRIVSLFVDGEDWSSARETSGDVPSGAVQFNAACTFKENGNCIGCVRNSLFLDGRYLIYDGELKIIDLSYGDYEDFEDEKYAIRLNVENLTKKHLRSAGFSRFMKEIP
ncbi:MAG: hypothetical protein IJ057_07370 [Bacteroidales bacterium]|nr:hypothetical protein [Bacteroidales bacterium]